MHFLAARDANQLDSSPYSVAARYAVLGRRDLAFRWLDRACERHDALLTFEDDPPQDHFMNRRLQSLIESLPEKPRMVMILRYQEDLMPEEIASVMEMPVRTVKSHLQRSLAMLREKIDRSMGDVR